MPVDVYAWPPVGLIAHENTITRPGGLSLGLSGAAYYSQAQAARAAITAVVPAIGRSLVDAGYIEQLKRLQDGKLPLVRITPQPAAWARAIVGMDPYRTSTPIVWTAGGVDLDWTSGNQTLDWHEGPVAVGSAGTDGGWDYLDCTGFPSSQLVLAPADAVTVGGTTARVLRPVTSDANGAARVYLDTALSDGVVTFGEPSKVFRVTDWPRAVQPLDQNWSYTFDMIEVFSDDYDGFTEINPWGT